VQLFRVHPEMNVPHAETIGSHGCCQRFEHDSLLGVSQLCRLIFKLLDKGRKREKLGRIIDG